MRPHLPALLICCASLSAWAQEPAAAKPPLLPAGGTAVPAPPATPPTTDITNAQYLLDLSQVHLNYGAPERAEPLLRKALEHAQDEATRRTIQTRLADVLTRRNDLQGATELLEKALPAGGKPESATAALSLADLYVRNKNFPAAEKLLTPLAQRADPKAEESREQHWRRLDALRRLLRVWSQQPGRLETVIQEREAAVTKDPKDTDSLETLVEIYTGVKSDPAKAVASMEKLAALRPADPEAQGKLGSLYQMNKQYDKALVLARAQLDTAPKDQASFHAFRVAQLMLQAGQKEQAVAFIKERIGASPDPRQTSMLSLFYEQAGMSAEAETALDKAAESARTPQEKAGPLLRLADLARRRKDYPKAESCLRAILKDSKDDKNLCAQAKSQLTALYKEQGKLDQLKLDN